MASNRLKLNTDKTEIMWLGTRHSHQRLHHAHVKNIRLGDSDIKVSNTVRNLGIIFDSELNLVAQAKAVTRSCFYQIRQLRSIRRLVSVDAAKTLVNSFISSRVDYCNSLYYGVNDGVHKKLQLVFNAAARLITGQRRSEHITRTLNDLHWLRVPQRVDYKIASITRRCMLGQGPQYLSDHLTPISSIQARSHLRSADRGDLIVPKTRTAKAGGRGFRMSGPVVWNSLPLSLRNYELSCSNFRSKLKTHLYN
jgi:hypothetical protein